MFFTFNMLLSFTLKVFIFIPWTSFICIYIWLCFADVELSHLKILNLSSVRQRLLNFPDALFSLLLTDTIVLQYTLQIMIALSIDFQTLNTVKQTGSLHPGAISIHKWLMKCCNSPTYLFVLSSILLSYLAHSQSKPKKI